MTSLDTSIAIVRNFELYITESLLNVTT